MSHNTTKTRFITHDLAEWVSDIRYEHLSESAIRHAKRFWLDSIACALGGSTTLDAKILRAHHRAMGQGGECTVLVTGDRTNPVDAAFLNSHLVRALDFNDIYWQADPAHPSDLICGPLALCEYTGGTGADLILATAIVYELQCRFAEMGRPGIREYGWHHATLSGFASALACGKVLNLSVDQLVNAIGICASRTGTLGAVTAGDLTMMKNTVDPWASRMGVESALLAQRGYTGPAHIIDGKEGLAHVFGNHTPARSFDLGVLIDGLPRGASDAYRIERCSHKSFPVEALMHSPLSALLALRQEHHIDPSQVTEVRVEVIARAADILGDPAKYRPTTRESADHSLPYAMAVALVDGEVTHAQFHEDRVRDTSLHSIMDTIRVVPNDAFESMFPEFQPCRVRIELRDGTRIAHEVSHPKGDPRNPMSDDDIRAKLQSLAVGVMEHAQLDEICSIVDRLEHLDSVSALVDACVVGEPMIAH
jgi:2-methylcitrate dehydratase